MTIGLDATYSLDPQPSGVGVYSRRVLHGLAAAHPDSRFRFCYRPHRFLRALREPLPANASASLLWNRFGTGGTDLFHALNQRIDDGRYRRLVCTFHDLFVITSEYSTPEFRARFTAQAKLAAERADLILAVSEFTAAQVNQLLGVPAEKIRVVHHGVDVPDQVPSPAEREPIILFTGAIQKRKNIARLVQAFAAVEPGWRLVLAGAQGYGAEAELAAVAASPRHNDIEVTGYIPAKALNSLWRRAAVFAFPSLDEGFGIPVLEAMASGVAVVTSNRSALPETAGDAAILVDPTSVESIAAALQQLTRSTAARADLATRGRVRAAQFSWNKTVEKIWKTYGELLSSKLS